MWWAFIVFIQVLVKYLSQLAVDFNNVYRMLFNIKCGASTSSTYVNNNVDSFKILLGGAAYKFRVRLRESSNECIYKFMTPAFCYKQSTFTHLWDKELYDMPVIL